MTDGLIVLIFILSLLFFIISFCLVRFYLYKYLLEKGEVESYIDFNLKSINHIVYIKKILFKGGGGGYYSEKIKIFYIVKIVFLVMFLISIFVMLR
ncbi:hypothetical protein [Acinetobacter sp. DSM 11652]|uniref:hypothetical protein n=1 Tax=Acinetobacter sp. DSM 11652 TaxID=346222 RepID=UPI0008BB0415|nr:hypothetical protein [Acinetobacter sp. DSM 11652]SEM35287.1 hypothetical protein SAMN05216500_1302 [Acinetobacter sp. DSM 11652]